MFVIGLTGNIACGKSVVTRMLSDLGAEIVDLDKTAHEVMRPGTDVHKRVVEEFGSTILADSGEIDRQKLGSIVFSDPQALVKLDLIVHPAVIQRTDELIAQSHARAVVLEAIKLIEAGLDSRCDSIWVVTCRKEQQLARLQTERGLTREQALTRVEAQASPEEKLRRADVVIDNSRSIENTHEQVVAAWRKLVGQ